MDALIRNEVIEVKSSRIITGLLPIVRNVFDVHLFCSLTELMYIFLGMSAFVRLRAWAPKTKMMVSWDVADAVADFIASKIRITT